MSNSDIASFLSKDSDRVAAMFAEGVEFSLWDLGRHPTFLVVRVDGIEPAHRITVALYDDQVFLPFSDRDPSERLVIADLDLKVRYGQVWNHANIELRVLDSGVSPASKLRYPSENYIESGKRISLRGALAEAYQMGGYGDRHGLRNSNGITQEEADFIAAAAVGAAADVRRCDDPKVIADRARSAVRLSADAPSSARGPRTAL